MTAPVVQPSSTPTPMSALAGGVRRHASEEEYRAWVWGYVPHEAARWERMRSYRRFVEQWPQLPAWFAAPLPARLGFEGGRLFANGRTAAHRASGYLVYLALVCGVGLDAHYILGRKYARLLSDAGGGPGLGVDRALFESHVARLTELGYPPAQARSHLTWRLGRLMLHRGDPDLSAITEADLFAFSREVRRFGQRPDYHELRQALYAKSGITPTGAGAGFIPRPPGQAARRACAAVQHRAGRLAAVDRHDTPAELDRSAAARTLRAGDPRGHRALPAAAAAGALRSSADCPAGPRGPASAGRLAGQRASRGHHPRPAGPGPIEDYLRWIPDCRSKITGKPLAVTTVKHEINAIGAFCRDTAIWGWPEVPGRPLITSRDSPRRPETLPRYLPAHELDPLMAAIEALDNPMQRAALLLARWSGARRDEIRRLTTDCLDTYPGGQPRLWIPVGKGHAERIIPLHPDAATALQHVIDLTKSRNAIPRHDPRADRTVQYVFLRLGKLLSAAWLFDEGFRIACTAAGLVDSQGVPTVSAHRMRHTLGTQLAGAVPVSRPSWPSSATGPRRCR